MTVLKQEKLKIPCSDFGPLSTLPALRSNMNDSYTLPEDCSLDEYDGLYVWYGEYPGAFPYLMQDNYDRSSDVRDIDVCVLENDKLRAVFIPSLGAKLHSLFDKENQKELLFSNNIIRPANLAARNAWTSGGIEWNFGYRGHHPYTCSSVHTARAKLTDGTPVLRFYWFERARCCVVQMDFFLPENSAVLYMRARITNPRKEVVPVYWWTNIAVERKPGDRVIAPANGFYTAEGINVKKYPIDFNTEKDQTYPNNGIIAKDYFFTTKKDEPHYIAQLGNDGFGLFEASTKRLVGRKLFIWGDSPGGRKWQNYLTSDGNSGSYDEIQCGLANTQYECLPMPPHTCWEWLESFGSIKADPERVFGDYGAARQEVFGLIDKKVGFENLEALLESTRKDAKSPADTIITKGDSYGALELNRREKQGISVALMNSHLDFGTLDEETTLWADLLGKGSVGNHAPHVPPASYMYQKEWTDLLEKAVSGPDKNNWLAHYLLGTCYFYDGDFKKAEILFKESLSLCENAWSFYCLALLSEEQGLRDDACSYIEKVFALERNDLSLAKEYVRILQCSRHDERLSEIYNTLPEKVLTNNRCRLNLAISLARAGRLEEAENILYNDNDGYLLVPDIREGEESITRLWFEIQRKKGIPEEEMKEPPQEIDFRMQARRNER